MQSPVKPVVLPVANRTDSDQHSEKPEYAGREILPELRRRFNSYTDCFGYKEDSALLFPLKLKYDHSLRVANDCLLIAKELNWKGERLVAAESAGLFHDIGRFPQYRDYRTFLDRKSKDHGEMSFEVMHSENILAGCAFTNEIVTAILDTVRYHNRREPPKGLPSESQAILNLVRDADKIDIIRVISESIRNGWHENHPEILLGIDINGPINKALVKEILETRTASYENVRSLADMHLVRMAWVFSINYPPALKLMEQRRLLEDLSAMLPANNPDVENIHALATEHIAKMLY